MKKDCTPSLFKKDLTGGGKLCACMTSFQRRASCVVIGRENKLNEIVHLKYVCDCDACISPFIQ